MSYQATKDMITVLLNPYQFFIINPYSFYGGLNLGFVLSESTRAYASCILGVNSVRFVLVYSRQHNLTQTVSQTPELSMISFLLLCCYDKFKLDGYWKNRTKCLAPLSSSKETLNLIGRENGQSKSFPQN